MDQLELTNPALFINRELSLLEFNRRVLAQALDERLPLLERLRFLCIASSNLDEFYEIRVAGLKQQAAYAPGQYGPDGLTPAEQLRRIGVPGGIGVRVVEERVERATIRRLEIQR